MINALIQVLEENNVVVQQVSKAVESRYLNSYNISTNVKKSVVRVFRRMFHAVAKPHVEKNISLFESIKQNVQTFEKFSVTALHSKCMCYLSAVRYCTIREQNKS